MALEQIVVDVETLVVDQDISKGAILLDVDIDQLMAKVDVFLAQIRAGIKADFEEGLFAGREQMTEALAVSVASVVEDERKIDPDRVCILFVSIPISS